MSLLESLDKRHFADVLKFSTARRLVKISYDNEKQADILVKMLQEDNIEIPDCSHLLEPYKMKEIAGLKEDDYIG